MTHPLTLIRTAHIVRDELPQSSSAGGPRLTAVAATPAPSVECAADTPVPEAASDGCDRADGPGAPAHTVTTTVHHHDAGMSTVEYAVGTVVAAAFAAVLYRIVTGDSIVAGLTSLVQSALNTGF